MSAVSRAQITAIHALKSRAGLDEGAYRDLLARETGQRSAKALTREAAIGVIDRLKVLSGQARPAVEAGSRPKGALELDGPYAGICRALWISGYQLGVVEDRTDKALVAFVRRQTGIDHLNWLRDAPDAAKVIEALKAWLTREAGVRWPKRATVKLPSGQTLDLRKWAVVKAQLALLGRTNERIPAGADLDEMMAELGRLIRRPSPGAEAAPPSPRRGEGKGAR